MGYKPGAGGAAECPLKAGGSRCDCPLLSAAAMTLTPEGLQPVDLTPRVPSSGLRREGMPGSGELRSERREDVLEKGERVGMFL